RPALSEDSPYPTDRVWPGGSHPGHTGHYERALGHTAIRIPTPAESPPLPWVQLRRLLLDGMMPAAARTYWLTTACRIRRQDQSLVIERNLGDKVHIPITDVRDIVAGAPVDLNSSVVALLNQHRVSIHFLSHYGDYAGSLLTSDVSGSGETVLAQARLASDAAASLDIARSIVTATAFNVRRIVDRQLLKEPYEVLRKSVREATTTGQLMAAEGNFRRTSWELIDTK